jgi:ankyrin repeat protein
MCTGHAEVVTLLLKRKANPATTNKRGQSVLELSKLEVGIFWEIEEFLNL